MEAVIFVGIQATGKSTFYKERFFRTHVRINLDMLKTRHREDVLLRTCIDMQQPFVVDNTNPTVEQRAKYIAPARAANFRIVGYYFRSRFSEALQRNERRPQGERVPPKGIGGTYRMLEIPTPAEGFDVLQYVRIDEEGRFVVERWSDDV